MRLNRPALASLTAFALPCCPPPCPVAQHNAGTSWKSAEDEDVPDAVPTLRAMPLRPHAVPTVILAGGQCVLRISCLP